MSRVFTDENLMNWEAYATGGRFGLPDQAKLVFHCVSDLAQRARYVRFDGDNTAAIQAVHGMDAEELRAMLQRAQPLD
jgi:hypothetical protein